MAEVLRESNPYDLTKHDEAPNKHISGDELLGLFKKYNFKIDSTNIPRFCSNNSIKMVKVKRIGRAGDVPTYYLEPSKNKIEQIIANLKNNNNSFLGKEILKKKRKEILRIFDEAKNNSVSRTSIAEVVAKKLGVVCNRKYVRKVLDKSRSSQLKKLIKIR